MSEDEQFEPATPRKPTSPVSLLFWAVFCFTGVIAWSWLSTETSGAESVGCLLAAGLCLLGVLAAAMVWRHTRLR